MLELNKNYWNNRWEKNETGWDIGYASTPLASFFDSLVDKELKILIPGSGNSYEAEYLFRKGFKNVFVIDIAPEAIDRFKQRVPDFPNENLICGDFFELREHSFDLIIEQTFFCAINPSLRKKYVKKMHELLSENGNLVGLLFNDVLNDDKPPFGGNEAEYRILFAPYFTFLEMKTAENSIEPRAGRELFFRFGKK
jgi:methyl halide transferase